MQIKQQTLSNPSNNITHASLFSGIGGFDLAAEWAGWSNVFNCEKDQFCQNVLKYHFPNAIQHNDIKSTDFNCYKGCIDILTGGFPCQPFSSAGKRLGTADERNLWPEMFRAIREITPRWVVCENVLGLINWSDGLVFEQVCADMESEGYQVCAFLLPAAGVAALHRRYRVWIVAHASGFGLHQTKIQAGTTSQIQLPDEYEMSAFETIKTYDFRSESHNHGVVNGLPIGLDECSIQAYGNSIVPQLAFRIFSTINTVLCSYTNT